jgi:hypothetical protein
MRPVPLGHQHVEGRDVVVALDQGRARADAVDQAAVQRPDGLGDRRAVGVDQQAEPPSSAPWPARWISPMTSAGRASR